MTSNENATEKHYQYGYDQASRIGDVSILSVHDGDRVVGFIYGELAELVHRLLARDKMFEEMLSAALAVLEVSGGTKQHAALYDAIVASHALAKTTEGE